MKEKKVPAIRFQGFTDEWEQRKVGNFYDFKNGLNKGKEFFGTGVPIVNFTDVFHHRGLVASQLYGRVSLTPEEVHNFLVKKGDIFFTRTSETIEEIGYPSVMLDTPKDTVFSGFLLRGRSIEDSDPLDDLFKKYVFFTKSFRSEMTKKSSITTRALTSGTSIKKMLFQYPAAKAEQHQIGLCITELDHLITLHQCKLTKLQLLKKSMLTKMFPKEGARVPEIRFQGFHKNWENLLFDDAVNISNDMVDPKAGSFDKLIHIGPGDIESHTGQLLPGIKTVSESHLISGKFRFYKGDIIYSKIRPELSKCVIAPTDGLASADAYILHCNKEMWQDFLYCILQTKHFYKYATSISMRTGMPKINREELGRYFFLAPSVKEQQLIGAFFTDLDHLISLHQRKLSKLQQIKQAMLSKLFV